MPKPRSRSEKKKAQFEFRDRTGKTHGGKHKSVDSRPSKDSDRLAKGRHESPRHQPSRQVSHQQSLLKLKGTIDKNRKGFAFIAFESRKYEDAFVPPNEAERLFHGDRVEVLLGRKGEVVKLKVLEHRFRELVGRFTPHPMGASRGGWVVYERKRAREEVFVEKPPIGIDPNSWVRAKLHFHEKGQFHVTAEILENFGQNLPPSADVGMIANEFNLVEEHTPAAEQEAEKLGKELHRKDFEHRTDLRSVPFITIDGETARDFDDAVYVERKERSFRLWVAIADVSHYVTHGTAIDKGAQSRGTSVYFPERAFHMLPRALSENLCSLKPHVPRLALVSRIDIDAEGRFLETEIIEAVIESKRRATYNEIEKDWLTNQSNKNWEYSTHFELFQILKKKRSSRGSIDFDLPEAEVVVQPTGEVVSLKQRTRLDAHRLIEEFMIAANESVTEWMMKRRWPFVYRIHEEPAAQSLLKFQQLAATVGVKLDVSKGASPKILSDLVRRLEGHPAQALLNTALLRSMRQAVYSSTHGIHFGLASNAYTHFTSPIRRYPDLVVHRLLRRVLQVKKGKEAALVPATRDRLENELAEICEHCSYRERLATDAERESIRLKQVRAMIDRLGDEFEAKIIGMTENGFFVKIADPYVEGMVSKDSLTDDFYSFNEERMIFYGRRKKRTFKMGDTVKVRAVRADLDRRQIDFGLIDT